MNMRMKIRLDDVILPGEKIVIEGPPGFELAVEDHEKDDRLDAIYAAMLSSLRNPQGNSP